MFTNEKINIICFANISVLRSRSNRPRRRRQSNCCSLNTDSINYRGHRWPNYVWKHFPDILYTPPFCVRFSWNSVKLVCAHDERTLDKNRPSNVHEIPRSHHRAHIIIYRVRPAGRVAFCAGRSRLRLRNLYSLWCIFFSFTTSSFHSSSYCSPDRRPPLIASFSSVGGPPVCTT